MQHHNSINFSPKMLFGKRRPDLLDLPIELIAKIIPPEDYSLHRPTALGIRIINNLPPHKKCKFVLQQLAGFSNEEVSDFGKKYAPYVFVTSELQISPEDYKKYIILEMQELNDYEKSLTDVPLFGGGNVETNTYARGYYYLKKWTGDFHTSQYLWLPGYEIVNDSLILERAARIEMPKQVKPKIITFGSVMFGPIAAVAPTIRNRFFANLTELTLNLTVDKYLDFMSLVKSSLTRRLLAPRKLHLLFQVGPSSKKGTGLTDTCRYRKSFPVGWITNLFSFENMTAFTLHYYAPGTTIEYPRDFFKTLTKVRSINIAIWNFDVTMLPLEPHDGQDDHYIQIKVALKTYNQVKDNYHRGVWKVILESDKATFLNERGTKLIEV